MAEHPLIAFLRARWDEEEADARTSATAATQGANWSWNWDRGTVDGTGLVTVVVKDVNPAHGPHIARHDPARVLADIAAKQRILARCAYRLSMQPDDARGPHDWDELTRHYFESIRDLAEPYADHDNYRQEWRP